MVNSCKSRRQRIVGIKRSSKKNSSIIDGKRKKAQEKATARQRRYRQRSDMAAKDAVDAAEARCRKDQVIRNSDLVRQLLVMKLLSEADTIALQACGADAKNLPLTLGCLATFLKQDHAAEYLVTSRVVSLGPPCRRHAAERWVLFANVDWKHRARKSTKNKPQRKRLWAVRSGLVAPIRKISDRAVRSFLCGLRNVGKNQCERIMKPKQQKRKRC